MTAQKPRILATRLLPDAVEARLRRDYAATLSPDDRFLDSAELVAAAAGMDGLLVCASERLTADVIDRLPASVRIVATYSVGYEHIDLGAARARGLTVTNTPDVLTDATADVAFLLILAAARRAHEGERMVREDRWTHWHTKLLLGTQVTAKRLGVLGMGRIGQAVARRGQGFDMAVHYHNRHRLAAERDQGARYHDTLAGLLAEADFLSINAPSSAATRHILNAQTIDLLPDGAVVVNTARGDLIDDDALIAALRSGKLAAAGLDVFDGEPRIDPRYRALANVFLLPHVGSATVETRDAMGFCCLDNLDAFFAGRPCPTALA